MTEKRFICCFSGGKDSTAMLIYILENNLPLDDIIYCDVGDWIWESAKTHIKQVEEKLDVKINVIDITEDLDTGFQRWGFPSFMNRWCTGFKRDRMRDYLKSKYGERERAFVNTLDIVVMKKKELEKNYIPVMKSVIHWLMQISLPKMLYKSVKHMDLILEEYMNIIVILTVGYVHYNNEKN